MRVRSCVRVRVWVYVCVFVRAFVRARILLHPCSIDVSYTGHTESEAKSTLTVANTAFVISFATLSRKAVKGPCNVKRNYRLLKTCL